MEQAQDDGVSFYFDPETGEILSDRQRIERLEEQIADLKRQMAHLLPDKSDNI
jgi:hypothetical protein